MKQQRHIQTTRTLLSRFRYWGRKNYAAFASMGREFQIGHLHTNVVDVALRKQNAAQTIPYHTFMTLQEIKDQVLAGIDISPDQAAWLATWLTARRFMPPRMRLPSHVLRTNSTCVHHQRQVRPMPGKLQMVCTILPLPDQSRDLRSPPR